MNHRAFIEGLLKECAKEILEKFDTGLAISVKKDPSQLVTEVDVAIEKRIIAAIQKSYPQDGIIAEESGVTKGTSTDTWIIDPIDGTSNFAYGMPWFGTMIAVLRDGIPFASGIILPTTSELYSAQRGEGAYKNGKKFFTKQHDDLKKILISFCSVAESGDTSLMRELAILKNIVPQILNIRATNSAVDYVYAAEGKLGGVINFRNKIWDVAPIALIAQEAGCVVSDIHGQKIIFDLDDKDLLTKNYTLLFANPVIHKQLFELIRHT